jgi:hypothetical protein
MREYEKIQGSEAVRALHLYTTEKGYEYGSSKFKGKTFDIILSNDKIKRVTFGLNQIWGSKHVACISETLKFKAETKYANGYDNYIDHMLDLAYFENGWSDTK